MAEFIERRKSDRRQGPIRSGTERRAFDTAPPQGVTRGPDRRQGDRRAGADRRQAQGAAN
ncbi:MAG: hypothetical protein ACR2IF_09670 [Terriglobales bacterium]